MKKLTLLGLILLALNTQAASQSAVEKNGILREQIIGEWTCQIKYPDMNLETLDIIEFQADGTSVGIGYFFFPQGLAYETKHTGKWDLKNNMLSEIGQDYVTIKVHADDTMKRINEDLSFRAFEEAFYQELSKENNSGTAIELEVQQVSDKTMRFEQILGNNRYVGNCKKSEAPNS